MAADARFSSMMPADHRHRSAIEDVVSRFLNEYQGLSASLLVSPAGRWWSLTVWGSGINSSAVVEPADQTARGIQRVLEKLMPPR